MAVVTDPTGLLTPDQLRRTQPKESRAQSTLWGHGSFVNMVVGAEVVNIVNVTALSGIGSSRAGYETGSPSQDAEEWKYGRLVSNVIGITMWLSSEDVSHSDDLEESILYAHNNNLEREFLIGIGIYGEVGTIRRRGRLYSCMAEVVEYSIDAALDSPVRLNVSIRPNGKLIREAII